MKATKWTLNEQKQEFNKKIDTQAKQIEKLMGKLEVGNTFNTAIVNNIQLLGYRQTDVSHLTDQDYKNCIKRVNHWDKNMIEKVSFGTLPIVKTNWTGCMKRWCWRSGWTVTQMKNSKRNSWNTWRTKITMNVSTESRKKSSWCFITNNVAIKQ